LSLTGFRAHAKPTSERFATASPCRALDYYGGRGNQVPTGLTLLSNVTITKYLCGRCGYLEEWVDASRGIQKLVAKYGERKGT